MSKVICDVCGTTYPETANQCPICGSAKSSAEQTAAGTEESTSSYAYVKGGRFSKKNVRRRTKGSATPTTAQRRSSGSSRNVQETEEPNNTGLVIVVILLLIAIASVVVYLILPFFQGNQTADPQETTGNSVVTPQPSESEETRIPCTSIQISQTNIDLDVGSTWTLTAQLSPADTTDTLVFVSDDETIATVDAESGLVTMVAEGETVITAICGDLTAQCVVKTPETVVTPDPGGDDPVVPGEFNFQFNAVTDSEGNGDVTLSRLNETWKAYKTSLDIDPSLITWTSDNTDVATIENGIVTAVGPGTTKVHAEYNGVKYTCIVRCAFEARPDSNDCSLNLNDVTITVGQTFKLKLLDSSGIKLDVIWKCDTEGVTIDGDSITGAASGTHKVYTVYNGKTYTCTVRIK